MLDQKIYIFLDTVNTGSFSACARKNYISQSAVSQQISKLEEELGFQLFDRSFYRPKLTMAGQFYYEACMNLKKDYEKIIQNAYNLSLNGKGIRIGTSNRFEKRHLPIIVNQFKQSVPIKIDIKRIAPVNGVNRLLQKDLNICFGMVHDFENDKSLNYSVVYNFHPCIICSKNHPLAQKMEVEPNQIKEEPVILLNKVIHPNTYTNFMKAFKLDGYIPNIYKECDNMEDFIMSVHMGEGIGYTVMELMEKEEGVVCIPLKNSHHASSLAMAWNKDEANEHVLSLMQDIMEYFKRL